ncbi:TIGR04282 family arsenosugar biosynthesis glycosyltransferase [Aurantiacibacter suaedae]|uniref:TIGR04282 family arsenosugar biosynthesis glycosyltransferase n=1 Tax=Aurantiacibacter suaedae TaxID=2545755 RepID=UPI0010F6EDC8|nr:TIGR04282 family arsenosugar biosynthesis glycosyltransferase [Aurantiacibacter suaedae]
MDALRPTVALFAKYPRAGEVKTRLIPALGEEGAAQLHRRLVERTIATVRESGLDLVLYASGAALGDFTAWLGEDVRLAEQGEGDLGARLARVPAPAILLGADIPDLAADHLRAAAAALAEVPVAIGPAEDGGYYLLAFCEPVPFLFGGMAWGISTVRAETERRLAERGVEWRSLPMLADCDRPEDLARWPDLSA